MAQCAPSTSTSPTCCPLCLSWPGWHGRKPGWQYSEFNGNRSFYRDGWKLVTLHKPGEPYDDTEWELYNIRADPTERDDLAGKHPELVAELSAAWEKAAWENKVFPLDDSSGYLATVRRPDEELLVRPVTILPGTPTLERYRSAKLVVLRSFTATLRFEHGAGDEGVLVAHGDQGGGYVLYIENGHLCLGYSRASMSASTENRRFPGRCMSGTARSATAARLSP
jgi:hypothetical protein